MQKTNIQKLFETVVLKDNLKEIVIILLKSHKLKPLHRYHKGNLPIFLYLLNFFIGLLIQ